MIYIVGYINFGGDTFPGASPRSVAGPLTVIWDVDYASTTSHKDQNQEEFAFSQVCSKHKNVDLACFVTIATAYARTWTLFSSSPLTLLWDVNLITRAQALTWIQLSYNRRQGLCSLRREGAVS